ncbi:MAG: GNAT family N-acetyltransferase [Sphingomicrobium sp.]
MADPTPNSVSIVVSDDATEADRAAIVGPLTVFNAVSGYPAQMLPVAVLLKDSTGQTIGGLWGKTVYDWLYVEFLVVPEDLRGQDLGTRLMLEAEALAIARGCIGAWLTTFTYQAEPFYQRLGYEVFGALDRSPRDSVRLFMRKLL